MSLEIIEKFSSHLKSVLTRALCFVVETSQPAIAPEHLLWALGTEKGCIGAELLHKANIKAERLRALVGANPKSNQAQLSEIETLSPRLSDEAKRIVEKAVLTANIYEHRYVGTEHLLSGLIQATNPPLEKFFADEKINLKELKDQLAIVLKSTSKFPDLTETISLEEHRDLPTQTKEEISLVEADEEPETKKTPALDFFGRDLTSDEVQAGIDPVIGRESEINRMMEILCRRTKNNPLLLGDPGVGKTAIVEGLAKKINQKEVPLPLQNKKIIALDLALVIAGTMYRGEFEGRLRQIIEEVQKNDNLILFIDEIHIMVGAGAAAGSLDAANILKPALARGEIRCIGATTTAEFKKSIESDSALERRFQSIYIEEPTEEKTLEILQGVACFYENFHGVRISPGAIETAVRTSARYIQDKRLPDKALDLLDEAAAAARVHSNKPGPIEQRQLLEHNLKEVQGKKRTAVVEERFLDAITLKNQEETLRRSLQDKKVQTNPKSRQIINEEDVARVITRMTGIPIGDLLTQEQEKLAQLEQRLGSEIIGQTTPVKIVSQALKRAKAGVAHPDRPLASFLFLGPSGVGKTELAKVVTREIFNDLKNLIRLDMSEYSEGFTMSKLIGAPAGYVGYREDAKLTDRVKQRPYSVILFDELEKAHPDVQNILLQILEEGEISDATGRKINFKNSIVIMTSNVGLERFGKGGLGFASSEKERKVVLNSDLRQELEERFRPELLNRIDNVCIFEPLLHRHLCEIAKKQLFEFSSRLKEQNINFEINDSVCQKIAKMAEAKFGARDIRRCIQSEIETKIADRLLHDKNPKNLMAELKNDKIVVKHAKKTQLS
ncbi:ATP-dependent Clp protease ATP-binding subunit [Patescibacteria group bacterium]